MPRFIGEHSVFGPLTPFAFLPPNLFDPRALFRNETSLLLLNFVEQQPPSQKSIQSLLTGRLAFHLSSRRPMMQHHAGGRFVNVLATVPSRADERFLDLAFIDAQLSHAPSQLRLFIIRDRKRIHGPKVNHCGIEGQ